MSNVRLVNAPPDSASPAIRDALLMRHPRCMLALPGCSVRSSRVVRTINSEGFTHLTASCASCCERIAADGEQ